MNTPANLGKMFVLTTYSRDDRIKEAVEAATSKGKSVFVVEAGCSMENHRKPERGDILLDCCSREWNLARDIRNREEAARFATACVLKRHIGVEGGLYEYGCVFLSGVTHGLLEKVRRETQPGSPHLCGAEFYRVVASETPDNLRKLLVGTLEGTGKEWLLDDGADQQFASARAIAVSAIQGFQHMRHGQGDFSIREWAQQDKAAVLFMPYKLGALSMCQAHFRVWIDIVLSESNTRTDNRNRALILDGLDFIGPIDGFAESLAQFCQSGGEAILGMNTLKEFRILHGDDARRVLETAERL